MNIIRTSGLIVPKTHEDFMAIERDLNRMVYTFNGDHVNMLFYEDLGDSILIPRFYPMQNSITDQREDGVEINITSKIEPRNERQKLAIKFLTNETQGVLQLEPGSGKTVISVDAVCKINRKAIIFAHKTKLLDQWKEEFLSFTDISEDDIGKLSTSKFSKIFEKKIILCTPHVIAYAVKHNKEEFLKALSEAGIGVAIFDEVHVAVGPEEFSKASLHLNCKRVFGLSATPTRNDGNGDIIKYHIGEVTYFKPTEYELVKPKIFIVYFNFGIYKRYRSYLNWGGKFSVTRYFKQMHKIDSYMHTVAELIKKCYKEGRTTLILGMRKTTLLELARKCDVRKEDIGIFIPTSTSKERLSVSDTDDLDESFMTKRLVFSTYQGGRDGNNREDFDCLIHSTPSSNVEQSVGRVLRKKEGKKIPYVFDLVDTDGPLINSYNDKNKKVNWFIRSLEKRLEIFESKHWDIESVRLRGEV